MMEVERLDVEVMVTVERGATATAWQLHAPPKPATYICFCATFKWPYIVGSLKVSLGFRVCS